MKNFFLLFISLFYISANAYSELAKYENLSDKAQISVLTVGTGDQLYALFGHTAVRIYDPLLYIDRVYNYGLFDFSTDNFYLKFVKGDLQYHVDYQNYKDFVLDYAYDDRSVYEQHIQLSNEQKQEFWQLLNISLEPQNRSYIYKFIDQNCTTKVVDLFNKVLNEAVVYDFPDNQRKYRDILNSYLSNNYFEKLGINLIFGSKVDSKSDMIFLPDAFMEGLSLSKNGNIPLVDKTKTLYEKKIINKGSWWNNYLFFSVIILILAVLMKNKFIQSIFFILMGLLGVFFIAVGFYSLHKELLYNNTAFLCNPFMLLLPFINTVKNNKMANNIFGLIFISNIIFVILNIASEKLIIALPLVVLTFWSMFLYGKSLKNNN